MPKKKYIVRLEYAETWAVWADSEEDAIANYTDGNDILLKMRDVEAEIAPEDYELDERWSTNA